MVAEQYLSCDSAIARSTAPARRPTPVTTKCRWIRVKTFGSLLGALRRHLAPGSPDIVSAALQDQHHVVGGAGARAGEHRLHRPRRQVAAAAIGARRPSSGGGRCRSRRENAMPLAGIQSIVHSIGRPPRTERGSAILQCSKKAPTLIFTRSTQQPLPAPRRSRTDCLLHLLHWWIQPRAAMPWAFFCASRARPGRRLDRRYDAPPQSSAAEHVRHGATPVRKPAPDAARSSSPATCRRSSPRASTTSPSSRALDAAPALSARLGNRVFFKREDTQPVFSFKLRGAYNKMAHLPPSALARGVICASAGNHAQGVALAARRLGCQATRRHADHHAVAEGRCRARARRRGRAARRQLLRRLRAARSSSRPSAA